MLTSIAIQIEPQQHFNKVQLTYVVVQHKYIPHYRKCKLKCKKNTKTIALTNILRITIHTFYYLKNNVAKC